MIRLLVWRLSDYQERTESAHCWVLQEHSFFMPPGERDYRPDVGVVTDDRRHRLAPDAWVEGAPNIAIEVLSPRTQRRDRGLKAARYYEQGTDEYWLFDPATRTAELYRRGEDGWVDHTPSEAPYTTPLLPGFALDLADLWRRIARDYG